MRSAARATGVAALLGLVILGSTAAADVRTMPKATIEPPPGLDVEPTIVRLSPAPSIEASTRGLETKVEYGNLKFAANITLSGKVQIFASWRDLHLTAEATLSGWRVMLGWPRAQPLANLVLLRQQMNAGIGAMQAAVGEVMRFDPGSMTESSERLRPHAWPLRVASEALDSIWKVEQPGWFVGLMIRGLHKPLPREYFMPELELTATATLVF